MLSYLKRRFSSTDLQEDSSEIRSGGGYVGAKTSQPSMGATGGTQAIRDYQYLPPNEARSGGRMSEDGYRSNHTPQPSTAVPTGRTGGVSFPSAPNSPTRSGSSGLGFVGTITGQLSRTRQLFSTETLNSIISDSKLQPPRGKYKILLVIDHPATDWAKYLYKRRICGDWDVHVEQAQFSDICISAFAEQGCVVTIQDNKGGRSSPKSFKPDFVLIRQGLSATPQHYENILTGLFFGGVPCINSTEAVYNMKNKAWLFGHLLVLRKKLGSTEFPLVSRSYQTKCQPITPDFPLPVTVRIGGDMTRECEVQAENVSLFQSLMNLANTTQRYATTEACLNTVCDIYIQKIGNYFKAFVRKPMVNSSLSSPGSTILEKIPLTSKFAMWINEVSSLFGGLDMCSIKVVQDTNGEYFIQDVFGSEFTLLGDGQEEDRMRIAELVLQKMEELIRAPAAKVVEPLTCVTTTPTVVSPNSTNSPMQIKQAVTSPVSAASAATKTSPTPSLPTSIDFQDRVLSTAPTGRVEVDPWAVQQPTTSVSVSTKSAVSTSFSISDSQSTFDPFAPLAEPVTTKSFDSSVGFFSSKPAVSTQSSMFNSGLSQNQAARREGGLVDETPKAMYTFGDKPSATGALVDNFASLSLQKNSEQIYSATEKSKTGSWSSTQPSQPAIGRPTVPPRQTSLLSGTSNEDADDTMRNLRKTFAGIFGDIA
uniref:Synapsin n=1 Tax=Schistocephalus solidus TaxID=70667 RepID=A0A0X3PGP7_SCHSO